MGRRHVIITDGVGSIGVAVARRFAALGDRVTVMARTTREVDALADEIGARPVRIDVGDPASVEAAFMAAGPADVLVNTAEMQKIAALTSTNVRTWEEILKINLTGAYLCSLKVLPYMIRKSQGCIVNVASTAGLRGYRYMVGYSTAMHGLVGFSRALAEEVGGRGITVNVVCPWVVPEPEIEATVDKPPDDAKDTSEARARPIKLADPDAVAEACVWLAGEEARTINGMAFAVHEGERIPIAPPV
ncbi:MAG: SDR family oxidoreductase [Deltaproteobacteria bacterium]|nr:SDR family oxidoreductase [Deltaproteobacteria bacterium]